MYFHLGLYLYINNLSSVITHLDSKVALYADDTAIFVRAKTIRAINDILNYELTHVAEWLNNNFLTLNVKKTKGMILGTAQKLARKDTELEVYINESVIENVEKFKYLGVWLDPSLTWSSHIEKISSAVSKRNGLLRRLRNILPKKTLILLYKTLIIPQLDYCDTVWGNAAKTSLSRLDKLQNAAGKIILGLPRRYPTEVLLNDLKWDKLDCRRNFHLNIMVYKSLCNLLPSPLCNIFHTVASSHSHLTRAGSQGNLVIPPCKSESAKRKFTSRGVVSFNSLPSHVKAPLPPTPGHFKSLCNLII